MSKVEDMVNRVVKEIRAEALSTDYDGRKYNLPDDADLVWKSGEKYRRGYSCIKYAASKILQPKRICEIGVSTGTGALAMLAGCPAATYVGIDNKYEETIRKTVFVEKAKEMMDSLGYDATVVIGDSQTMLELPYGPFDLVHVDGCHTREAAKHDVTLAWKALNPEGWILVDDGRDVYVCTGTFEALAELPGGNIYWGYFEDTTGSILIHKVRS